VKDPLASKLKWKLKKFGVAAEQITTVFSVEKPVCDLIPLSEEQRAAPQDFGAVEYLRLRVMPVLGTSPAIFGQTMASYVTCMIAGKPYEPDSCDRMSKNLRHKMLQFLRNNEVTIFMSRFLYRFRLQNFITLVPTFSLQQRRFGSVEFINVDDDELEFLVQQVRCFFVLADIFSLSNSIRVIYLVVLGLEESVRGDGPPDRGPRGPRAEPLGRRAAPGGGQPGAAHADRGIATRK
jgi:hypothetical protein